MYNFLQFYLESLSEPRFRVYCKDAYFNSNGHQRDGPKPEPGKSTDVKDLSAPSMYSQDLSLHATFHIQDVDSFGEWQIVVSSGATKYLRELRRRDGKKIQCVLKKIRQVP